MRRPLVCLALLTLTACESEPPPSAPAATADSPLLDLGREAHVLSGVVDVDSAVVVDPDAEPPSRFVQLEVRALGVSEEALRELRVDLVGEGRLAHVVLDARQKDRVFETLQAWRQEHANPARRYAPVVTASDGQPVRFSSAAADLAVDLRPRLRWAERCVDLDLEVDHQGARSAGRLTLPDHGAALLRVGGAAEPRWALLTAALISLDDEDARRFNVDRE